MQANYHDPSEVCEMCGGEFEGVFFEVRILTGQQAGRWKYLCSRCFSVLGCKLGNGIGKMYLQNMYGELVEVRGKVEVRNNT
jgi:hypothetical protein